MVGGTGWATVYGVARVRRDLATKPSCCFMREQKSCNNLAVTTTGNKYFWKAAGAETQACF